MKLNIALDIAAEQAADAHGRNKKIGVVLHETVSPNYPGLGDVRSVSHYLAGEGLGIHGITDADGNIAWARGLGKALFYHTLSKGSRGYGYANTNYIGIEQVSRVMLDCSSRSARYAAWLHLDKEMNATAKLLACISRAHGIPLIDNRGDTRLPGVTTHWEVTQFFGVPGGHVDCWPYPRGGYYPKLRILALAKRYYQLGYSFR